MPLTALMGKTEIRKAYEALTARLRVGAKPLECRIGHRGGAVTGTVYWRTQEGLWWYLNDELTENRYWFCLGLAEPERGGQLAITCEINSPFEGVNLRVAGMFAKDEDGVVHLCHSGRIGGGQRGVGKWEFLAFYRGASKERVVLPDREPVEMLMVGSVSGVHLPAHIAHFVREVARFKNGDTRGGKGAASTGFTPEFAGQRKGYKIAGSVESCCDHGLVIGELAAQLTARGLDCFNDRNRDLYIPQKNSMATLFEAKTDVTTSSLYGAVGQLMLHGAAQSEAPSRVAVLPDTPSQRTMEALKRLGIRLVTYTWVGSKPVFDGLEEALT